jgi:hypothetical protein
MVFSANFGGHNVAQFSNKYQPSSSYQITVFFLLLGGSIIWISYRAFLTSELSIIKKKVPFSDLEGLHKSGY